MKIRNKYLFGGALALASLAIGVGGLSNNTFAAYDAEGTPANEAFTDNVFYEAVVDSYHEEKYRQEHNGSIEGFSDNYDYSVERKKSLTNEQLASIKVFSGGCPVVASQIQSIKSFDGLELLTGLEKFDPGTCGLDVDHLDFSSNTKLKYFLSYLVDEVETIDFSNNMLLEEVYLMSYMDENLRTVYLPDSENLKNIFITSFEANNNKTESSLPIVVHIPTYQSDELGLGGGDAVDVQYKLNLSRLGFFYDSSTAGYKKENLVDEQFAVDSNQNCYSLNADAKILSIKESCIENGKIIVGLTHKYKIDGNQVSARFEATINFVDVYALNFFDGAIGELNDFRSEKIALGDSLDTEDYLSVKFHTESEDDEKASFPDDSGYELKGVKVIYATVPMSSIEIKSYSETGLTNHEIKFQDESLTTKDFGKIDDDAIKTILVMYNYVEVSDDEDVKVPDTGFFTNEDGELDVVNTLLVLAGLSIAGALGIYSYRRVSGYVKARRF